MDIFILHTGAIPLAFLTILIVAIVDICQKSRLAHKRAKQEKEYRELEEKVLKELEFPNWDIAPHIDVCVTVKSRQALGNYDATKFFKEDRDRLGLVERTIQSKCKMANELNHFLSDNEYKNHPRYDRLSSKIDEVLGYLDAYRIKVTYITPAGNNLGSKEITIKSYDIDAFKRDPSLLMSKSEYNSYVKEQKKETLERKHHEYYDQVNSIIDFANKSRDSLVIKGSRERLEALSAQLFYQTVNSIQKIKTLDSEEWEIIGEHMAGLKSEMEDIVNENKRIFQYYQSDDFLKVKNACETLMGSQREFNEYISEKVDAVSRLFGTRMVRGETINEDEYGYVRPYRKTITPFTAEVSATVFASAENNPMDYIVKYFYPDRGRYPEQIQKLYHLIEELETLKDAKQIIENDKAEYQQYLGDVPDYIMECDEAGFYSRLGFADIDEAALTVEYKFAYTSGGGRARRSFSVPMNEENICELIKTLENKLTAGAFAKEQRNLMTKKLRESIKKRDNFTCCSCGNSIYAEPNLLLEIDHIIPVSRGGRTVKDNLQTLCWKCNRAKSNKLLDQ